MILIRPGLLEVANVKTSEGAVVYVLQGLPGVHCDMPVVCYNVDNVTKTHDIAQHRVLHTEQGKDVKELWGVWVCGPTPIVARLYRGLICYSMVWYGKHAWLPNTLLY